MFSVEERPGFAGIALGSAVARASVLLVEDDVGNALTVSVLLETAALGGDAVAAGSGRVRLSPTSFFN